MVLTFYRYSIVGANWRTGADYERLRTEISAAVTASPFQGSEPETQYGFANCQVIGNKICGLFVQKFKETLTDYDSHKQEQKKDETNSGKYVFIIVPETYEVFLQAKKSANLPKREEIVNRFVYSFKNALNSTGHMFSEIKLLEEKLDRQKIVALFYQEADKVIEMQFKDFDVNLIAEEKVKRNGQLQKYFNPREEYQEAMDEAAMKFAQNADSANVRAKQGADLRKDPTTRAMLEGARTPMKIVYVKEGVQLVDSAMTKNRETLNIEGDPGDVAKHLPDIIKNLFERPNVPQNPPDDEDFLFKM